MSASNKPAGERLTEILFAAKVEAREQGRTGIPKSKMIELCQAFVDAEVERIVALRVKHTKPAKAKDDDDMGREIEEDIYDAYPRKIGKADALKAILVAMKSHDPEKILSATRDYATAVSKWPHAYRHKDGRDTVPYPATWFHRGSFLDDPKEWYPATQYTREDDPESPHFVAKKIQNEPVGWRIHFPDYIRVKERWENLDDSARRYVCEEMAKLATREVTS